VPGKFLSFYVPGKKFSEHLGFLTQSQRLFEVGAVREPPDMGTGNILRILRARQEKLHRLTFCRTDPICLEKIEQFIAPVFDNCLEKNNTKWNSDKWSWITLDRA